MLPVVTAETIRVSYGRRTHTTICNWRVCTRETARIAESEVTVSMSGTDKRKQSLYFPESMLQDIQKEAARLDRSLSWIVQRCVKIGLPDIRKLPSVNEIPDDEVPGANV